MAGRPNDEKWTLTRPMNVEEIVKKAQTFDYNPLIPLKYWFRTAGTLLKEVCLLLHSGAWVLTWRE